jgi:hypothetical protein
MVADFQYRLTALLHDAQLHEHGPALSTRPSRNTSPAYRTVKRQAESDTSATTVMSVSRCAAMNAPQGRDHGGGLGLAALERLHCHREPRDVGQQPDVDLRVQATFLGEPWLAELLTSVN